MNFTTLIFEKRGLKINKMIGRQTQLIIALLSTAIRSALHTGVNCLHMYYQDFQYFRFRAEKWDTSSFRFRLFHKNEVRFLPPYLELGILDPKLSHNEVAT